MRSFASVRLKVERRTSDTPEIETGGLFVFCLAANQQTKNHKQQKWERSRNSLAESAGKPAAREGRFIPMEKLGQDLLKFWLHFFDDSAR